MGDKHKLLWETVLSEENRRRVAKVLENPLHSSREWPKEKSREAAVLIPLVCVEGEPSILFTVRSRHLSRHRGQVSFPGGLADKGDGTPENTALREVEEELGIQSCSIDVWGNLNDVWGNLNTLPDKLGTTLVTPILGHVRGFSSSSLKLNPTEVGSVFTLSLKHLARPSSSRYTHYKNFPFKLPSFLGGQRRIWGLTGMILNMTLAHILPRELFSPVDVKIHKK